MDIYSLPKFNLKETGKIIRKTLENRIFWGVLSLAIVGYIIVFSAAICVLYYFPLQTQAFLEYLKVPESDIKTGLNQPEMDIYNSGISYEQAIINAAKNAFPSVVSIVIYKNVPIYEEQYINPLGPNSFFEFLIPQQVQKGTQLQEVGAGSGFIVSEDGLVLTNKHVVLDNKAEYAVFTSDGQKYTAKVLALDPVQDLAIIKIQSSKIFKPAILGDSSGVQIGQTAIAIGNALGKLSNTVSVGVVSGLQRTISASDQSGSILETLEGIIQTDAAINSGNSGGPLLNLKGEVIGINTAMAQGAEAIGFAIPIDMAKRDIAQVKSINKIIYPFLGVRYVLVDDQVKQKYNLSVDYGALVLKGSNGEPAITPDSSAAKAGIKEDDVILAINGEKITSDNSMAKIIQKYNPGDKVILHILRGGEEQDVEAILGERS